MEAKEPSGGGGGRPPKIIPAINATYEQVIKALVKPVKHRRRTP